jgi:hypothetical protein
MTRDSVLRADFDARGRVFKLLFMPGEKRGTQGSTLDRSRKPGLGTEKAVVIHLLDHWDISNLYAFLLRYLLSCRVIISPLHDS